MERERKLKRAKEREKRGETGEEDLSERLEQADDDK